MVFGQPQNPNSPVHLEQRDSPLQSPTIDSGGYSTSGPCSRYHLRKLTRPEAIYIHGDEEGKLRKERKCFGQRKRKKWRGDSVGATAYVDATSC
ncbi:hypothetical protein SLA2020_154950 [Shorea laevis]